MIDTHSIDALLFDYGGTINAPIFLEDDLAISKHSSENKPDKHTVQHHNGWMDMVVHEEETNMGFWI